MTFRFKCTGCGEWHEGIPTYGAKAPLYYYTVPEGERNARCALTPNTCVVDRAHFFVRGCIEVPIHGETDPFIWGVWVSLSALNYEQFVATLEMDKRSHLGPFFGWLSACFPFYPDTENLKTHVHLRDHGIRPYIELEPTEHPLAVEQRRGITPERVGEFYAYYEHGGA